MFMENIKIVLTDGGPNKSAVLKALKEYDGSFEQKKASEIFGKAGGFVITQTATKDEAKKLKKELEAAGATVKFFAGKGGAQTEKAEAEEKSKVSSEESNASKNRAVYIKVLVILIISIGINVLSFILSNEVYSFKVSRDQYASLPGLFSILVSIIILVNFLRFNAGQCPMCDALKGKKEIGSELIDTTYLGNKWKNDGTEKNVNMNQYAVFDKTYRDYNCCKYCGYEWTTISEGRSEERL
jgi:hypothetical protein